MIGGPAFDQFISANRWTVITTLRRDGRASSSLVAYARDGDQLVISTRGATLKARTLRRDPRVSLCIINNAEPFNFVAIDGRADVEQGDIVQGTRKVFANIAEAGWQEPDDLEQWIIDQGRVLIRITPERVTGVIR